MDLVKEKWSENDGREFVRYLETFRRDEKVAIVLELVLKIKNFY